MPSWRDARGGWVAGLQLAALAMRDHADVAGFIASFTGSNRHVVDYLAEEVVGQQPPEVRDFLLQTSILGRMTGPLCDAVTGDHDGGLLEVSSGRTCSSCRSTREALVSLPSPLRRLAASAPGPAQHPHLLPELHRKASAWFEGEQFIPEAVHHSLAAQDWERAIRLIETSGMAVVLSRQVPTVLGWIDEIPEALVRERPSPRHDSRISAPVFQSP